MEDTCSRQGERKMDKTFWWYNLQRRYYFGEVGVGRWIILNFIPEKKCLSVETAYNCFKIVRRGVIL
jgi:hypothetical protein